MNPLDIEEIFSYHKPDHDKVELHQRLREVTKEVAHTYQALLPASPEGTLAIRKLQEALMYANAAVAIYG